jgi:hypothetical protein
MNNKNCVLKGHWHDIFCTRFFKSKLVPQPPDSYPKAVSNINLNLPRYSNSKHIPWCGPAPPEDLILRCGPPWGIWSPGVAPPPLGIQSSGMWPLLRDCYEHVCEVNPTWGSDSAMWPPPGVSNFPLWPLPWDLQPHRGIVRIFFESPLLPLKGQSMKNVCMVENTTQGL